MDKKDLKYIADAIKALDVIVWEASGIDVERIGVAKEKLFDVLENNGYYISEDYELFETT